MHHIAFLLGLAVLAWANPTTKMSSESTEVHLSGGKVRGSFMTSRQGKRIHSFRGLRYAEPPTGELRFKQAVPVKAWSDVFDATEEGPSCPQPGGIKQSEDCLRLNVYTTALPKKKGSVITNPNRPVIVFFHPGAFYVFSGQSHFAGPQYLADKDVVLVTPNYRLGSLGFLSTGDAVAPGNLGLKDQVEALRWVKKNIASFGGDPNSVTITGCSAGSWSAGLHMLSPMSRGLFHRVIASSGSAIYQTPLQSHQYNLAVKQAQFLNCPTESPKHIVDCLKTKDPIEMASTLRQFAEWHGDPVLVFAPVVEPAIPGVERFLTDQPSDLIKRGEFAHVPIIAGNTKDEFGSVVIPAVELARDGNHSVFEDLEANFEKIAPISYFYERDTPRSKEISAALKQFYFKGKPISLDTVDGLSKLYADALVNFNVNNFIKLMSKHSRAPVYAYNFAFPGRYSWATWPKTKKPFGTVHHDDLLYLFHNKDFPYFSTSDPEYEMVKTMTSIYSNFAKHGHPIPHDDPKFRNVEWTPYNVKDKKYLHIANELTTKSNLHGDRMAEWERLFPIVSTPAAGAKVSGSVKGRYH